MDFNTLLVITKTAIFPSDYQETLYYKQDNAILNIIFLIIFSIVILILVKYLKKIISVKRLVLLVMIYTFIISILFAILRRDYVQFDPFHVIDQANNFIRENYSGLDKGDNYLYLFTSNYNGIYFSNNIIFIWKSNIYSLYNAKFFNKLYNLYVI